MAKVYITDHIQNPEIEREILGSYLGTEPSSEIEILLVWHQIIDRNYLSMFPNLKVVIRYGVGFDQIDLLACTERGIRVCNNPDYCTNEVSHTAVSMILNIARGIGYYDSVARHYTQGWQENILPHIRRVSEQTVGFIGVGRIGSLTLTHCQSLRFQTQYYDPYVKVGTEAVLNTTSVETLSELLATSDIVSLHCPLTDETRGMVNQKFLESMKPGASLINTARGQLLENLDILESALRDHYLNAVALDTLPSEPPQEHPLIKAWRHREPWLEGRLIINPHVAFYSQQSVVEQCQKAANNALRCLQGKSVLNCVSKL